MKALIKLGYSCNNNCSFCHEYGNVRKNLGDTAIKKIILESEEKGCDCIVFSGGEPTIRKDFAELIKFASSNNLTSEVVTNARVFKIEKIAEECAKNGLKTAHVSFLGSRASIHDEQTKAPGSFEQTVIGIKNLLKNGVCVKINVVVNKLNIHDLKRIVDTCKEIGKIDSIKFSFVEPKGKVLINFQEIVPRMSGASKSILEAIAYAHKKGMKTFIEGLPPCLIKGHEKEDYNLKKEGVSFRYDANKKMMDNIDLITDNEKTKPFKCKSCLDYNQCDGAYKIYLEKKGDDELNIRRNPPKF